MCVGEGAEGDFVPTQIAGSEGRGAAGNPGLIFSSDRAEKNQQTFTTKCLGEIRSLSSAVNFSSLSLRQGPQDPRIQDSHEGLLKSDNTQDAWLVYDGDFPRALSCVWLR